MFASSAGARRAYVVEDTFDVTPTNPTFKIMRTTSGGMRLGKTTIQSEEIQADENIRDEPLVGIDANGSYNFEFSYGSFDDILEGALFGQWSSNVLKNGVNRKTFLFEETIELGSTDSFSRFPMSMISAFNLDIQTRRPITGSFSVMAKKENLATSAISGATYSSPNTKDVMAAGRSVGGLSVAGVNPAPKLRRLQFQVSKQLRTRPVIDSLYSEEFGQSMTDVTGTIEAYMESNDLYQAVIDHGGGAVSATIGHVANEKYTFSFPKVIFLDGTRQIGGRNDDIIVSIPFRAVYDSGQACSIKITRAVA